MRPITTFLATLVGVLFITDICRAGKFTPIDVNKSNQKVRSKDYFAIETAKGEHECNFFTVHVKANPLDKQVRGSLARLEIFEGDKRVSWIPLERLEDTNGGGYVIKFELSRELAAKCTLVLVELTMEAGGNVYRVNLESYVERK